MLSSLQSRRGRDPNLPRECRGQASVELVALIPLIALLALAFAQAAVAGWALVSAGEAARAGARAAHVGGDVGAAVRRALPGMLEPAAVSADGGQVRVEIRAPMLVPGVVVIPLSAAAALGPEQAG